MGSDAHYPEEAPAHRVVVDGFWIDRTAVTNAQFLKFVKATGHVTLAEQAADQLRAALVGDDVLALDQWRWQAMADSPSPHWRAVHAQARRVHPRP